MENSGKLELERIATSGMIPDKDRLAATLTELCLDPNRPPNQNELDMFFDIIRSLIHDIEMHVRKKLSEGLADRGDAPRDLVVMLANDVIEVAAPVLLQSPILQDADLIELIMERTTEHRIAISKREHLNEAVSEAFVDKGDQQALKSLLQNDGAAFSEESMQRLVDESRDEADFQELLLSRRDLPEPLAHRMYDWVSEALRRQIAAAYPGVADEIDEAVAEAVASAMESDGLEPYDDDEDWTGLPSPRSLQRALEMQDILKFEDMFQEMTGLDAATTTRVLYDMGPEGLAVACRAAGLDAEIFDDIFCHLQGSRPYTAFRKSPIYTRGMKFFERTDRQNARSIIAGWGPGG